MGVLPSSTQIGGRLFSQSVAASMAQEPAADSDRDPAKAQGGGPSPEEQKRLHEHLNSLMPYYRSIGSNRQAQQQQDYAGLSAQSATLSTLLEAGMHLGHSKSLWHALNVSWIFGERHGIHIINLEHTLVALRRAAQVVESVAYQGGIILFVGTRKNTKSVVLNAAMNCGQYHVTDRWIPGTLTNAPTLLTKHHQYVDHVWDVPEAQDLVKPPADILKAQIENLDGSTDQRDQRKVRRLRYEQLLLEQQERAEAVTDTLKSSLPDLIIALNPFETKTMLREAKQAYVPTIGLVDTNMDPRDVTYVIPGNDDSVDAVALVAGILSRAAKRGTAMREHALKKATNEYIRKKELEMRQ
ncbi:hypothetical protein EV182_001022 [Spiromyces aspiralis]|uniref:Uncharacterized protein n=1 Tax=Spiromyces aspiralis TaxID=68401 RepID=A0ACC1HV84_9FUNG|nr:hypothetical protein EV182_001022 [Spiromyces aspiralis]